MLARAHFILYVSDQAASAAFYSRALEIEPRLDEPGMTELLLPGGTVLGLMPRAGASRLLGLELPDPATGRALPAAELYLLVDDPGEYLRRAVAAGAVELSPPERRGWGHVAAYCLDPDGHVLAFATED
jgi:catechol 2,3-dioxygenase-like lactoylglutathione lyase family enzyme